MNERTRKRAFKSLTLLFPQIRTPRAVNHDWTAITSDRRVHREVRTFFLGEIFECHTDWGGLSNAVHPGLVTRKQARPGLPVEMAPSRPRPHSREWVFSCADKGRRKFHFLLWYRRPVPREAIGAHLATLSALDKERLSKELQIKGHGDDGSGI